MENIKSKLLCLSILCLSLSIHAQQTFTTYQAANLVIGQLSFATDSSSCSQGGIDGPSYCAISSQGWLAVANQGGDRTQFWNKTVTTNGQSSAYVLGASRFNYCSSGLSQSLTSYINGVGFSPDGNKIIVTDAGNNRVLIWNSLPTSVGQPADVVLGQTNFTSSISGTAANKLYGPLGVYVSASGKLIVSEWNNNRVLIWNSIPTVNGTPADVVVGQPDFTTSGSGNAANQMSEPWGLWVSPDGKLLVADQSNNRILIFDTIPTSNNASADVVIGQTGFGLSTSGISQTQFTTPVGVTVSPDGVLAIGEYNNSRVLIYNSIPTSNGAAADVVLGQPNFTSNSEFYPNGTPTNQNLYHIYNVSFDLYGRLFVAGRDMNRIMVFGTLPGKQANLQIKISTSDTTFCPDSSATITVTITNSGPDTATGIVATASLPTTFTYSSSTASTGSYNSFSGYWNISSLAPDAKATLTINGVSTVMGIYSAYADIVQSDQLDTNLSHNGASVNYDVNCPCKGTPTGGSTVSTANPVCSGVDFTLSLSGSTSAGGLTYQWQSSPDNSTWSNISSAVYDTISLTQTSATYYRCHVICTNSGLSAYSTSLHVTMITTCYCTPTVEYCNNYAEYGNYLSLVSLDGSPNMTNNTGHNSSSTQCYTLYSPVGGTTTTSLTGGNTYSIGFQCGKTDENYVSAWIDFNNDGVFSSSEMIASSVYLSSASTTFSSSFTVPGNSINGPVRLRVILNDGSGPTDPCGTYEWADVEDYQITLVNTPCSGTPAADTIVSTANPACNGENFTLSLSGATFYGAGIDFQWQSSPNNSTWTNISGATDNTLTTSQAIATYYRCQVTCTNSGLSSYSNSFHVTMTTICYCTPTVEYCSNYAEMGNYLSQVSLNGTPAMYNNTGHSTSSTQCYTLYAPVGGITTTTLSAGVTYSIGFQGGEYAENYVSAWIDFNNDGVFSSTEMIASGIYMEEANTTYSSSFTVPGNCANGSVRLRVILNDDESPTDPCGTYDYCDVEDYQITLFNTPCSGTPTAGTIVSTANPVCNGADFTLSLTGTTTGAGIKYQWESSPDNSTWTNISGANVNTFTTSQAVASYYRCSVSCTNSGLSSNTTSIYVTMTTICYCTPTVEDCSNYAEYGNYLSMVSLNGTPEMVNNTEHSTSSTQCYTLYAPVGGATSTTLSAGNTYYIGFQSGEYAENYVSAWIDFNDDGVFSSSEMIANGLYLEESNTTYSSSFTVPVNCVIGTVRLRVILNEDETPTDPCGTYDFADVEDYTITLYNTLCSGTPTAGTTVSTTNPVCNGADFTLSLTGISSGTGLNYQWQLSPDNSTWTNITDATGNTLTTSQAVSTYYRCKVTCTGSGLSSNSTSLYDTMTTICYCTPTVEYCSNYAKYGNYLTQVSLNGTPDMTNNTGHSSSSTQCYTLYAPEGGTTSTTLSASGTYSIGFQGGEYAENYVSAWIDFNNDGVFSSTEMIASGIYMEEANTTYSSSFTVPGNCVNGSVRMRVILNEDENPAEPCGTYDYSDVEDYTITLYNPPCTGAPTAGTTVSSFNSVCNGADFTLSLTGSSTGAGINNQWQSSPDNSTWTSISGATGNTFTTSQAVASYYRCHVACSNSGLSSNSSSLDVKMITICYCIPVPSVYICSDMWISNVSITGGITNFNNEMNCAVTSYTDYSGSYIASNSQLAVTNMSFTSNDNAMSFSVWIDYNDDGVFETSEQVIADDNTEEEMTTTGSFTVPGTVAPGTYRMRVRADYYDLGAPSDPCKQLTWGQTQDYGFKVTCSVPTISASGSVLASSSASAYQWYLNGTSITGATSQFYDASQSGFYQVSVTNGGGCKSMSDMYNYIGEGISASATDNISIYPNPANDKLQITGVTSGTVEIINTKGQIVTSLTAADTKTAIDISGLSDGVYIIKIMTDQGIVVKKLIKQ